MTKSAERLHYEAVRLALWSVMDALDAASHIAGRASDCFDGSDLCIAFNDVRQVISELREKSPEMQKVRNIMFEARESL